MKGVVFTELIAMAEAAFGENAVDEIITNAELESGGAYTAVGTYPSAELFTLVQAFSDHSGMSVPELQRAFGRWLFDFFVRNYSQFFKAHSCSLNLLEVVEQEIHAEVRKLYPDANLPEFYPRRHDAGTLELEYRSTRPLAEFCHGLIEACCEYYQDKAGISRDDKQTGALTVAIFVIKIAARE